MDAIQHCYSPIATDNYRQALDTGPSNVTAAAMFGRPTLDGCGEIPEAHAIINNALKLHPHSRQLLRTAIYIKKIGDGPFEEIVEHLRVLEQLKNGLSASEFSEFAFASPSSAVLSG